VIKHWPQVIYRPYVRCSAGIDASSAYTGADGQYWKVGLSTKQGLIRSLSRSALLWGRNAEARIDDVLDESSSLDKPARPTTCINIGVSLNEGSLVSQTASLAPALEGKLIGV
jgi:hypothetical protein